MKFRDVLEYAAPIAISFIPGIGPVAAGLLSGGITALASGSLEKGLYSGLLTGGLGSIMGSLGKAGAEAAAAGAGEAGAGALASGAGEMAGVEAAQQAAAEMALEDSYGKALLNASTAQPAGFGAAQAAQTTPWQNLSGTFARGDWNALGDAVMSKGGMYAGLGGLGIANTQWERKQLEEQQRLAEAKARRMQFGPGPGPGPARAFNYEDPYASAYSGRTMPYFAKGGLAALPGMDRDIHRRRSGAAMLRRMYPSKKAAIADLRNPDSPVARMGITDARDPLLNAAFPEDRGIGRLVTGPGDGTSDSIPAVIDGTQPAALSSGEFVIPAAAVSAMGGGSTEAGARKLQMMVDRTKPKQRRYA